MRTFKSSPPELLRSFFLSAAIAWCCFAVTGALLFTLIRDYDIDFGSPEFMGISIASASAISLLVIILRARISVEVTDEAVLFYRNGRLYKKYDLSSYIIGSYVYRTRIYFIPVSVAKYLTFTGSSGKQIKQKCTCFAMSEFENLLSYIRERNIEKALNAERDAQAYENPASDTASQYIQAEQQPVIRQAPMYESFYIPRENIIGVYRKRNKAVLTVFGVIVLVTALIFAFAILASKPNSYELPGFGYSLIIIIFTTGAVYYLASVRPFQKLQRSLPSQITVSESFISVDSDTFYYPNIVQIKATPPGYTGGGSNLNSLRKMTVTTRNGGIREYCLGFAGDVKGIVSDEYGLICRVIEIALVKNGSVFTFEL